MSNKKSRKYGYGIILGVLFISFTNSFGIDSRRISEYARRKIKETEARERFNFREPQNPPLPSSVIERFRAQGYIPFQCDYMKPFYRKTWPRASAVEFETIKLWMAKNETKPLLLGIRALRNLPEFSYRVTDLRHETSGQIIKSAENVKIGYMFFLWLENRQFPGAILDLPSISIPEGENRMLWAEISIPFDAEAGVYRGEIILLIDNQESSRVPFKVEVYPFILDEAKEWGRGAFLQQIQNDINLTHMREHGMNMISGWTSSIYSIRIRNGRLVTRFRMLKSYLARLDRLGYTGPHAWFLGGGDPKLVNAILRLLGRQGIRNAKKDSSKPQFRRVDLSSPFEEYLCDFMRQWHEALKSVGHEKLAACLLDEPDHRPRPERMDFYNRIFEMVERNVPEVTLYGVFYHEGDERKLSHHHHVWCSNGPLWPLAKVCREAGRELWTYGPLNYGDSARFVRYTIGFAPWVYKASGSFFWANFWMARDLVFYPRQIEDDRPASLSIYTRYGPLPSVALKGYHAGVVDRRYLVTLEKLIDQGLRRGGRVKEKAEVHKQFLAALQDPLAREIKFDRGRVLRAPRIRVTGITGRRSPWVGKEEFAIFLREDVALRCKDLAEVLQASIDKGSKVDQSDIGTIYPNPVKISGDYRLMLSKSEEPIKKVKIYNLLGQHIAELTRNEILNVLSLTKGNVNLSSGVLFYEIITEKGLTNKGKILLLK
jgi:hypothetical protein